MLFEAYDTPALSLPNRIVMVPMTRTRATEDGVPTELNALYYAQRAGAGLIVTECTRISLQGHGIIRAPGIHKPTQIEGWRRVTDAVHDAGGRIYLQIWHPGRVSHPAIMDGELPVAPSPVAARGKFYTPDGPVDFPVPHELTVREIADIVLDFERGAQGALTAGFDGLELHGAFGYLPDQFLQDGTNRRGDSYGGPVRNRARFMLEVVEALIGVWGRERVGIKLSPSNRFYGMFDSAAATTFGHVISELNALKVGYLHLMEPSDDDLATGTVQIPSPTRAFREQFSGSVITNGGYTERTANDALEEGIADLVSFGKLYLANPDLPERFARGAPLNEPRPDSFYGEGAEGYTDYPSLT